MISLRSLVRMLLGLTLIFPLGACALLMSTFDAIPRHDAALVACKSFRAITWDPKDTDQTIVQVKQHNAAYDALCDPPKP